MAIYMVADGPSGGPSLDRVATEELFDILHAAGSVYGNNPAAGIYVAVQVDQSNQNGLLRFRANGPVMKIPEANAAEAGTLQEFFDWVVRQCPARHYAVLFWGHSSGPVGLFGDRLDPALPVTRLTLPKLGGILRYFTKALVEKKTAFGDRAIACGRPDAANGKPAAPIDIVLFKNCWMSTLETAYELKGVAQYMLASQAEVPQQGWPYAEMFDLLAPRPGAVEGNGQVDVSAIARRMHEQLGAFYDLARHRPYKDEVPFALVTLEETEKVGKCLDALARHVSARTPRERDALDRAARGDPALIDLLALCESVRAGLASSTPAQRAEVESLVAQLEAAVTAAVHATPARSAFGGLSVFCRPRGAQERERSRIAPPSAQVPTSYADLAIMQLTNWMQVALRADPPPGLQASGDDGPGFRLNANGVPLATAEGLADAINFSRATRLTSALAHGEIRKADKFTATVDLDKALDFDKQLDFDKALDFDKQLDFDKALDFALRASLTR